MLSCGLGGQLGDSLLHLFESGPRAHAVAVRRVDDEWNRSQRDQCEQRLEHEHRDRCEQDRHRRLDDEDQPVAEEEAHRLEVHGHSRHQLSGLLAVEERQLERLQPTEQRFAEVVLDAQRDAPGDQSPSERQGQPREAGSGDRQRVAKELAAVMPVANRVHGRTAELGNRDGRDHCEPGKRERDDHACAVRPQEAKQPAERLHFTKYSGGMQFRRTTPVPDAGICAHCAQQRLVTTTRGSVFSLCERSRVEPERFPRYPRLPVLDCAGYEPRRRHSADPSS